MSTTFERQQRNTVQRMPERGNYDRETIYQIVDEALICHVGFVIDRQPFVIPTLHARDGDRLLLHGSVGSRLMHHAGAGGSLVITVTHVDGIVLARSSFNHSINYRSAVIFGSGQLIADDAAKLDALARFTERLIPGRWDDARVPNRKELKATTVVAVPIDSASAKVRTGPPKDEPEDYTLPIWAGVLPLRQQVGTLVADEKLPAGIAVPEYLENYVATRKG